MKDNSKIDYHQNHLRSLKEIDFYEGELKFFENELSKIVSKNPNNLSKIDHVNEYKKIFLKKKYRLMTLRLLIRYHESKMMNDNLIPEEADYHHLTLDEVQKFVVDFEEMKQGFKRFAAHND